MPWIYLKRFYPIRAQTSVKNKIPCNTYTVIPAQAGMTIFPTLTTYTNN